MYIDGQQCTIGIKDYRVYTLTYMSACNFVEYLFLGHNAYLGCSWLLKAFSDVIGIQIIPFTTERTSPDTSQHSFSY